MREDGGSRLSVELSRAVEVKETRTNGAITFTLQGASLLHRNDANPLVTVHFNSPVTRARLIQKGGSLAFVVELRADAAPSFKVEPLADGKGATLRVDFPSGEYLGKAVRQTE